MSMITNILETHTVHRTATNKIVSKASPFVQWVGGKRQLMERYMEIFPKEFDNYYEPFLGGGSVFFELYSLYENQKQYFLSDINEELVITYNEIKNNPNEVKELFNKLYERHTKEFYYEVRNIDREKIADKRYKPLFNVTERLTNQEIAARFVYLNMTCFNAIYRVNKTKQFNVPIGTSLKKDFSVGNKFEKCSEYLLNAEVAYQGYEATERTIKRGDFVYLDPPYAPLTATSNFTSYTKEGFDVRDQKKLRDFCDRLDNRGVLFAVSNSNCELIRDLYKNYKQHIFVVNRNLNSKKDKRKDSAEELLITNF